MSVLGYLALLAIAWAILAGVRHVLRDPDEDRGLLMPGGPKTTDWRSTPTDEGDW